MSDPNERQMPSHDEIVDIAYSAVSHKLKIKTATGERLVLTGDEADAGWTAFINGLIEEDPED